MNGMNGNSHYKGSLQFSGWARNGRKPTDPDLTPEAAAFREYAKTQATLALAYEQRTASLIALFQLGKENLSEFFDATALDHNDRDALAQQIATRLGLTTP